MILRWGLIAILTAQLPGIAVAQANPPQPVQVAPGTSHGLLISKVQPTYPPLARQARVQGTVVLRALIAKDGSMENLTVISGHPMLIQAALDAVKQWRYKSYLVEGKPVEVETTINVNFQLSEVPPEAWPSEPAPSSSASNPDRSNPPQGQDSDLKPYTTCDLGPDFRIVQVDGPMKNFAWPSPTKDGDVRIPVEVGYRVLINYMEQEPFGNLKVERLPKSQYGDAKANLMEGLQFLATEPGTEPNTQTVTRNGSTMYGTTQNSLGSGTLSTYYLFLEDKSVLVSMYLLNAEPRWRLFNTIEEYKKIRDQFLDVYSKCVALAQTTQPAGEGSTSDQYPGVHRVGGDVSAPKATYAPDPVYAEAARQAKLEGSVVLWLVVDANGLPQDIKVQRSLGMGLDEEAIKAVKRWRFQPAMKDGKPVPVMINVQVNFRLYDDLYPNPDSTRHPPSSATNQPAPTPNGSNLPSQTPDQTRPQGYQTTKGEYEKAAAAGDVAAMSALGDLYYFGDGVPQDYRKAREWYEKAASEGDAVAMRYLANLYYHGQEVQQDYQKAREWNEKAADGGDAVAMGNLGLQYYHGQGAPQDYQKAREWFEKAASSGNSRAMINLAHMYYQGEGVSQSDQKSKEWLEKAAAKGDAYAQQVLGTMPNTAAVPERTKGISIHLLPKRVADLGGMGWGLSVDNRNLLGESEPPVLQTPQEFLSFVRRQDTTVQENGVWIVMTDPDAYSNFEKVLLEDIKALCRAEKIPLFICRAIDLPNGWKRYDQ